VNAELKLLAKHTNTTRTIGTTFELI
jgi:hypothetical protein